MSRIERALDKASKSRANITPVGKNDPLATDVIKTYMRDEEHQAHLRDYLDVLFRRKWIVIVFLISVLTTATIATLLMTPLYKARATIKLRSFESNIVTFKDVYKEGSGLETQYNILKSRNLASRVVAKLPTLSVPAPSESNFISSAIHSIKNFIPIFGNKTSGQVKGISKKHVSVGTIFKGLEIVPIKKSSLVNINFISEDPVFAANAANKVAEEYALFMEESKLLPTQMGGLRLRKEVEEMGSKLEASEKQLGEYIAKSQFLFNRNDADYENLLNQKFSKLTKDMDQATSERITKEAIYKEVNKSDVDYSIIRQKPMIQSLTREYTKLEAKYFNLMKTHKPEFPTLVRLKDQIEILKDKIEVEKQKIINSLYSDYQVALKKEKLLSSTLKKLHLEVTDFQKNIIEFQILKREVETNREIYSTLLQRLKEVDITAALTESDVQILDRAEIPKSPFKPKIKINIILSLILGLFGGAFLAFFIEYFDSSIKTDNDIEKISPLPVLGKVPTTKTDPKYIIRANGNGNGNGNSKLDFDKAVFSEAFRFLSTRIQHTNAKSPKQILITSSMAQEGKTVIAVSIARSLMTSQEKGIIIDADLRRPDVQNLFDIDNSTGLSTFLTGESKFNELIKKSPFARLDVITSGPEPKNPTELFNSSRMRELVDALSATYDYIIFDSAPVLGMSDSLVLSAIANNVIVVVKANSTPSDALIQTTEALNSVHANILGFILNGVDIKSKYTYSSNYYCSPYLNTKGKKKKLLQ